MPLTEHVRAFCHPKPMFGNYNLGLPWHRVEHSPAWRDSIVATDARSLVSCECDLYSGPLANDTAKTPNIDSIVAPFDKIKRWQELPGDLPPCELCDGTGMRPVVCEMCLGDPMLHPCDECGRTGRALMPCKVCAIRFRGRVIGRAQFNRLVFLPEVRWGTVPHSGAEDVVFFRFQGGYGAVNGLGQE